MRRRIFTLLAAAAAAAGLVVGVETATSDDSDDPHDPRTWVLPDGQVDRARVPDRIRFSSDLAPGGIGWIESAVLAGDPSGAPDVVPIYATRAGSKVLGWFDAATGRHTRVRPVPSAAPAEDREGGPATTVVGE
jgi:hypothetical protein